MPFSDWHVTSLWERDWGTGANPNRHSVTVVDVPHVRSPRLGLFGDLQKSDRKSPAIRRITSLGS